MEDYYYVPSYRGMKTLTCGNVETNSERTNEQNLNLNWFEFWSKEFLVINV